MDIAMASSRSLSREISVAAGKPILLGIHHLALVTDNMRMTLDFYVRVLGMPIVHGLRTPSRAAGVGKAPRHEIAGRRGTVGAAGCMGIWPRRQVGRGWIKAPPSRFASRDGCG